MLIGRRKGRAEAGGGEGQGNQAEGLLGGQSEVCLEAVQAGRGENQALDGANRSDYRPIPGDKLAKVVRIRGAGEQVDQEAFAGGVDQAIQGEGGEEF